MLPQLQMGAQVRTDMSLLLAGRSLPGPSNFGALSPSEPLPNLSLGPQPHAFSNGAELSEAFNTVATGAVMNVRNVAGG
eukprot:6171285-Heterocapsa_arctica.AAC.1